MKRRTSCAFRGHWRGSSDGLGFCWAWPPRGGASSAECPVRAGLDVGHYPGAINEAVQQLAYADTVVVNKTDLVKEDELKEVKAKIKSVNAFARMMESQKVRHVDCLLAAGFELGRDTANDRRTFDYVVRWRPNQT